MGFAAIVLLIIWMAIFVLGMAGFPPIFRFRLRDIMIALGGAVVIVLIMWGFLLIMEDRFDNTQVRYYGWTDTRTTLVEVPKEEGVVVIKLSGED
jgi:hypothetical protein